MRIAYSRLVRSLLLVVFALGAAAAAPAQSGRVVGRVTDAESGDPLPGANIRVQGTALGVATDVGGEYRIPNAPAGSRTLVVSYLGYESLEVAVEVPAGGTVTQDVRLRYAVVQGEEVVVTAQLEGQAQAINQQLSSNTIVSVVSQDRIRELPDQNAAEAIGRLPGISVQRDAGEGQKLVVRGLSPRFNSITVNGERIPSTDPSDRSVDLSLISPDVLAGIEVFKALRPDMDADAIGGTVNLVIRRAPEGFRGNVAAQYGYNARAAALGQYKASATASNRFLGERLGVLVTGSAQRADRDSDILTADYTFRQGAQAGQDAIIDIDNLNLADRQETRDRYSASLALDYDLGSGDLLLSSFMGRTDRDELQRRKRYRAGSGTVEYDLRDRELFTLLYNNALSGRHSLPFAEVDWQLAHSHTLSRTPFSNYARFVEVGAYTPGLPFDQGPEVIPGYARNSLADTWYQYGTFNPERTADRDLTAQLNARIPLRLGAAAAGYVKLGGKLRDKRRTRDLDEFRTPFAEIDRIGQASNGEFVLYRNTSIAIENFLDSGFETRELQGGQYELTAALDPGSLNAFHDRFRDHYQVNHFTELSDYDAGERIAAAYLMTELNLLGQRLMLLPGVRYERTSNDYDGRFGSLTGNLGEVGEITDTTGGRSYGEWLPMAHLRYKFNRAFDVRLAVTRTLSRPDYFNLVPYRRINEAERTLERGDPNIRHTKAWNYDLFLSLYSRLGLLSAGFFYKELEDIDYRKEAFLTQSGPFAGYRITEPTNAEASTVYGVETDLQTNLRFLPSPLDGIVLNANFTYVHSETLFPFLQIIRSPIPPFRATVVDTVRAGRLPGQAAHVVNLAVGYEKGGFSGRISMVYQGSSLQTVGLRGELDGFTDAFTRWDASLSQRLPFAEGLTVFLNLNNLTDQPEEAYLGRVVFPTRGEFFGWTGDAGLRYNF